MPSTILSDPGARTLVAGELAATFLPAHGMLGASLTHRGVELLRRVDDLDGAAAAGRTAGIPLLHPWANRLAGFAYALGGRAVALDSRSRWLSFDANGLPIHGVPWSRLVWQVVDEARDRVVARFDWTSRDLCELFPFPHSITIDARLDADRLTVATTLEAISVRVPVSFGFHPYIGVPGVPRAQWQVRLPPMRKLTLDPRHIPTGSASPFPGFGTPLGTRTFDDGYALDGESASLSIAGGGREIAIEWLEGYRYAQVYAPATPELIAFEPMTAPTNALISEVGLTFVEPGAHFRAVFGIRVA